MTLLGLQKLLYGRLRPTEIEQLYEKAWFAITETCLAMTIFREEVGAWFLVMFVGLLAGRVWGWIGEGRVEVLEQQPPSNPRLFHIRLSLSLLISAAFDTGMLSYSVKTVLRQARPNMMVMFAFEFAVLCVSSISTCGRYLITLRELFVIDAQTKDRRDQLRRERQQRAETAQLESSTSSEDHPVSPTSPTEDDVESEDIDVPGWEEKGKWIFTLELLTGKLVTESGPSNGSCFTDLLKLILYLAFFCVLCTFYGMPIHIIRDVALTIRSFHKRILDFIRYRQATRDMNTRYPDAAPEDIKPEDCCIICREDMRPWPRASTQDAGQPSDNGGQTQDERFRPKKLPCGHILHFACLRSWLERQQNCPTCRAPVLVQSTQPQLRIQNPQTNVLRGGLQARPQQQPAQPPQEGQQGPRLQNGFQLGPLRVMFGAQQAGHGPAIQAGQPGLAAGPNREPLGTTGGLLNSFAGMAPQQGRSINVPSPLNAGFQLFQVEQQLLQELQQLQTTADELTVVRALLNELARLRSSQAFHHASSNAATQSRHFIRAQGAPQTSASMPAYTSNQGLPSMGSGHEHLPANMTLPEGWTVLPLQPMPAATVHHAATPAATSTQEARSTASNDRATAQSTAPEGVISSANDPAADQQTRAQSNNEGANGEAEREASLPQWGSGPSKETSKDVDGASVEERKGKQTRSEEQGVESSETNTG